MKINSNSTAVLTNNYLHRSEKKLAKATQRLSSGYKLNNASDDPAGYAISSVMKAQIESLTKATNNANTGANFIQTGEGALTEVHTMLQRMNELAVQAANGTNTSEDRGAIQNEIDQLCEEIERLAKETEFNGQPILNGNYEYRGYTDQTDIKVLNYSDETRIGKYDLSITLGADGNVTVTGTDDIAPNMTSLYDEKTQILTMKSNDGSEIKLKMENGLTPGAATDININLTGIGAMRLQIGANEGQVIEMSIPEISLEKMGLKGIDVTSQEGAKKGISQIEEAIAYTSAVRSKFGAYENRLDHAIASLAVTDESMNAAYATIVDTDMAAEMTNFTALQVLQQAGTSMLAQANQFPQQALQLLQ